MMVRVRWLFIMMIGVGLGAARADIGDVSRIVHPGEFSAHFGAAFVTGRTRDGHSQTDFSAGRIHNTSLTLDYSPDDNFTVQFSTDNDYSDTQIGVLYKIWTTPPLKFEAGLAYGPAWTRRADNGARYGRKNVTLDTRLHGVRWRRAQWSVKLSPQFVKDGDGNFWNIKISPQVMYYFLDDVAAILGLDYAFLQISRPKTIYNRAISAQVVYNMSTAASINPYVKYHFETRDADNNLMDYDNYWKLGVGFSVKF